MKPVVIPNVYAPGIRSGDISNQSRWCAASISPNLFWLAYALATFPKFRCNLPCAVGHTHPLELGVIFPDKGSSATAVVLQHAPYNGRCDIEAGILRPRIARPAIMGEAPDGGQVATTGKFGSDCVLSMCVSMPWRVHTRQRNQSLTISASCGGNSNSRRRGRPLMMAPTVWADIYGIFLPQMIPE
jgi:hypothetical protein